MRPVDENDFQHCDDGGTHTVWVGLAVCSGPCSVRWEVTVALKRNSKRKRRRTVGHQTSTTNRYPVQLSLVHCFFFLGGGGLPLSNNANAMHCQHDTHARPAAGPAGCQLAVSSKYTQWQQPGTAALTGPLPCTALQRELLPEQQQHLPLYTPPTSIANARASRRRLAPAEVRIQGAGALDAAAAGGRGPGRPQQAGLERIFLGGAPRRHA